MPPLRVWMQPFSSRKRRSAGRRGRSRRRRWLLRLGCVLGLLVAGCLGREPNQRRDPSPRSAAASQPRQPCDSEAGQGDGPCSPDLGGLCVDLLAPQAFGETTGGETGVATLAVAIPARAAVGTTLAIQAVVRHAGGAGCASKTDVRTVTVQ